MTSPEERGSEEELLVPSDSTSNKKPWGVLDDVHSTCFPPALSVTAMQLEMAGRANKDSGIHQRSDR